MEVIKLSNLGKIAFLDTQVPATNLFDINDIRSINNHSKIKVIDGVIENEVLTRSGSQGVFIPASKVLQIGIDVGDLVYTSYEFKPFNTHVSRSNIFTGSTYDIPKEVKVGNYTRISGVTEYSTPSFYIYNNGVSTDGMEVGSKAYFRNLSIINLTETFGKGNEPTAEQMDMLFERFPNQWFDGTTNLFNAKCFINNYHKKVTELENAITALGGSL